MGYRLELWELVAAMRKPKTQTDERSNRRIVVFQWVRHFVDESTGPIVAYLILPVALLMGLLLFGCLTNDVPIIPICILVVLFSVLIPLMLVKFYRSRRRIIQVDRAAVSMSDASKALILELNGGYTPYVIEAAEKLGLSEELSVSPALLLVLERAVAEERAGWEDIAKAIIEALGNLGDPRALPVLLSLQTVKGVRHLPSLKTAIEESYCCAIQCASAEAR